MKYNINNKTNIQNIILTLDIDWAPDFAINWVAEQLVKRKVRATWFVTHNSPAIDRLRRYPDLFELGIHPNFFPGSSHGRTVIEVLNHCMSIVPEATSMRTHGLFRSSVFLSQVIKVTPIKTEVSVLLPYASNLCPVEYYFDGKMLTVLPFYWEDDMEMERPKPVWSINQCIDKPGLKIYNFHPLHVYLNSTNMLAYEKIKKETPAIINCSPDKVNKHIYDGLGTRSLFKEIIERLASYNSLLINEVYLT